METKISVKTEESGERIDALLACQEAIRSRSAAAKLLEAGLVTLRGAPVRKNYRTAAGDIFEVILPEAAPAKAEARRIYIAH